MNHSLEKCDVGREPETFGIMELIKELSEIHNEKVTLQADFWF